MTVLSAPGRDDVGRRALAEQERERVDEHRLARAGFAGEHVEAGLERQRDVGDDGEVADAQLRQASTRAPGRSGHPTGASSRSRMKKLFGPKPHQQTSGARRAAPRSRSPGWIGVPTLAVERHEHFVRSRAESAGSYTTAVAGSDERPDGERVRADRRDHDRVDGRHARSARRPTSNTPSSRSGSLTMMPSAEYCADLLAVH